MADVKEIKQLKKGLSNEGVALKRVNGQAKDDCEFDKNGVNGVIAGGKPGEISVLIKTAEEKKKIDTKTEKTVYSKNFIDDEREEGELISESEDDNDESTLVVNETKKIVELISPCFEDIIEFNVSQEDLELIGANEDFIYGDYEEGEVISIKSERILEFKDSESIVNDDIDNNHNDGHDDVKKKREGREKSTEKVEKNRDEYIEISEKENTESFDYPEDGEIQSPNDHDNDSMVACYGSICSSMFDVEMLSIGGESANELKIKDEGFHNDGRAIEQNSSVESLSIGANVVIKTVETNNAENEKSKNGNEYGNQARGDLFSSHFYEINMGNTDDAEMISAKSLPLSMDIDVVDSGDSTTKKNKENCLVSKKVENIEKLKVIKMTDNSGKEVVKNLLKGGNIKTTKNSKDVEKDKVDNAIVDLLRINNVVKSSKKTKDLKKSDENEYGDMINTKSLSICMDTIDDSAIQGKSKRVGEKGERAKNAETEKNKMLMGTFPLLKYLESTEEDRLKLPSQLSSRSTKSFDYKEKSQSKRLKQDHKQPSQLKNSYQSNRTPAPLNVKPCCSYTIQSRIPKKSDHLEDNRQHPRNSNISWYNCFESETAKRDFPIHSKKKDKYPTKSEITETVTSSGDYEDAVMVSAESLPVCMEVAVVDSNTIVNSTNVEATKSIVADKVKCNRQHINDVGKVIESVQQNTVKGNKSQNATTLMTSQGEGANQRNTKGSGYCITFEAPGGSQPKGYNSTSNAGDDRLIKKNSPTFSNNEADQNDPESLPIYGPNWLFPSPKRIALSESELLNSSPPPRLYRKERALRSFINKERPPSRRSKPYDKTLPQSMQPTQQVQTHIQPHSNSHIQHQYHPQHQPQSQHKIQHAFQSNCVPPVRPTVPLIVQPYCPFTTQTRIPPNTVTLYDERGRLRHNGADLCDCGYEHCDGCWYNCFECGSKKCGFSCRCKR